MGAKLNQSDGLPAKWHSMSATEQLEVLCHVAIARPMLRASIAKRLLFAPKVFVDHYLVSRRGGSAWWFAARLAAKYTWKLTIVQSKVRPDGNAQSISQAKQR